MDVRNGWFKGYPEEMLNLQWDMDQPEEDDLKPEDIRLRGPRPLKEDMEQIADLITKALKDVLERRRGMSANRLWLSIAQNFRMALVAKFGPLPQRGDELARRQYAERIAATMKLAGADAARKRSR